jgi:muramoyltetrapeptide carboxypeptidase
LRFLSDLLDFYALKPVPLKNGDTIAIAAPAGPFDRSRFQKGVRLLKKAGFRVSFRKDIFAHRSYLAGDDARRTRELSDALSGNAQALLFARGGFGCQRVVPHLNGRMKVVPKIVMGSSDLTVVLLHLWKKHRLPSLYGPMVAPHLTDPKNIARAALALTDIRFFDRQRLTAKSLLKRGTASGRLIGGCLSLVVATLGTPWEIDTRGTILFLEDTNEEDYAVDRMLTQLEQAGKFKGVKGLVFGTFRQRQVLFPSSIKNVLREKFRTFPGPVLWGIRFGHCKDPLILPFGGRGRVEGKRLIVTEGIF